MNDPLTYALALVAVVSEVAAWALRRHAQTLHERAERGRRMGVLDEALGPATSGLEAARLHGEFSTQARRWEPRWNDPEYWATQGGGHKKGPALLRIICKRARSGRNSSTVLRVVSRWRVSAPSWSRSCSSH